MMKYIQIDNNTWLVYDTTNKRMVGEFTTAQIETEIASIETRMLEIPSEPSDDEYLAWAKQNMPIVDYSLEKSHLESRKSFLEEVKRNIN